MKRSGLFWLAALLLILQAASLLRIGSLRRQLEQMQNESYGLRAELQRDTAAIYANVDAMLKREASLIETASTALGDVDAAALAVPVTFSLTPKEVGPHTAVSLDFGGSLVGMERDGRSFSATVPCSLFGGAAPMIVIEDDGVSRTTRDDRVGAGDIRQAVVPQLFPRLEGQGSYGGGTLSRSGQLTADCKQVSSGVTFEQIRFVVTVDDSTVFERGVTLAELAEGWSVDQSIALREGQTCRMQLLATDSLGLEHRYLIDAYTPGEGWGGQGGWPGGEEIRSADGTLLYSPEFLPVG